MFFCNATRFVLGTENRFPSETRRVEVGASVGLTEKQVNTWLAYRRQKEKKESERPAG